MSFFIEKIRKMIIEQLKKEEILLKIYSDINNKKNSIPNEIVLRENLHNLVDIRRTCHQNKNKFCIALYLDREETPYEYYNSISISDNIFIY